jgi:hypothetical protein
VTAGSRGDVEPFVALAERAQWEGHEVRLVVPRNSGVHTGDLDTVTLDVDYTRLIEIRAFRRSRRCAVPRPGDWPDTVHLPGRGCGPGLQQRSNRPLPRSSQTVPSCTRVSVRWRPVMPKPEVAPSSVPRGRTGSAVSSPPDSGGAGSTAPAGPAARRRGCAPRPCRRRRRLEHRPCWFPSLLTRSPRGTARALPRSPRPWPPRAAPCRRGAFSRR